jgi:hypothetical protein
MGNMTGMISQVDKMKLDEMISTLSTGKREAWITTYLADIQINDKDRMIQLMNTPFSHMPEELQSIIRESGII